MEKIVIDIKNLNKDYKMFPRKIDRILETLLISKNRHSLFSALTDINLQVKKGEVLGILGKNGAGKSTILKIITGVTIPTSGSLNVVGRVSSLLELGAAFNMELTGIENIYQHGQVMGLTKEEIESRVQDIITFADIGDHLYQPVKTYSSGMFARLAFACAINVDPDILIVDEVLSVGDIAFQLKCFKRFEEFKNKGKTIIFVSHNINDILTNCTRAIILENGTIAFDGSTKDAVNLYKKKMAKIEDAGCNVEEVKEKKANKNKKSSKLYKEMIELNKNLDRYGNKKVELVDFCLFNHNDKVSNIIDIDEKARVYVKLKSSIDVDDVMVTFSIKDFSGIEYCGISEYVDLKKGQCLEINYCQKLPLKPERYTLSFGCVKIHDDGNTEVYDRIYDCILFQIVSNNGVLGFVKLDSDVTKVVID